MISDNPGYEYVISIMSLYRVTKIASMGSAVGITGSDLSPLMLTVSHDTHPTANGYTIVSIG